MTDDVRLERLLGDVLEQRAPAREPDQLVPGVLDIASRTRRWPRLLALIRERPMRLNSQVVVGSPSMRAAYVLAMAVVLTLLAVGAAVAGTSLLAPTPNVQPEHGAFNPTGRLVQARFAHTATLLADGRVLVLGGATVTDLAPSSELWEPGDGSFSLAASLGAKRASHTATLLPDGRILVVGGNGAAGPLASAEVWDPAGQSFTPSGPLLDARVYHTATLLGDGRVLVVGGWQYGKGGTATSGDAKTAEVWDPTGGTFSPAGSLLEPRYGHSATLLKDGRVLVLGGWSETAGAITTAELWDPRSGSFSHASPPSMARIGHTATVLPDGRVLVVGGGGGGKSAVDSAELWDPATESFGPTGFLGEARSGHTATLLPDGHVLIIGGYVPAKNRFHCPGICIATAEIWDPTLGSFIGTGSLNEARTGHTATLLPDGRVLVVGGGLIDEVIRSAEVYDPLALRP